MGLTIELKDSVTVVKQDGKKKVIEKIIIHIEKDSGVISQIYISPPSLSSCLLLYSVDEWDAIKAKVDRMIARMEDYE